MILKILSILFTPLFVFSKGMEKKQLIFSNGKKLTVEIADDFHSRNQGLMNRKKLGENEGMLFIFPGPEKLSFWMKNTYIDLTIGYFGKDKKLKEKHFMKAQNPMERNQNLTTYESLCLCQYALEVNQGWFKKAKVKKGMSFELKALPKAKN